MDAVADRRPKPSRTGAALSRRIDALERELKALRAEVDLNKETFLKALARIPGARGSMPPPRT